MFLRYTVPSDSIQVLYAGDSVTTVFPVPYSFYLATDLIAIVTNNTTSVQTTLVLNSDYTVSGGAGSSGSITIPATVATGTTLAIVLNIPFTQEIDLQPNDPFPAEVVEEGMDRGTKLAQQLLLFTKMSPKLPPTYDPTSGVIRIPLPVAGKFLVGKSDASGWDNVDAFTGATLPTLVSSPQDKDLLRYDGVAGTWKNAAISRPLRRIFTASGTYTPTVGMIACDIECVGGGGGGGGTANTAAGAATGGNGGGGGGYSLKRATAAQVGASQTVTIGAAGTAGTNAPTNGGNGGDTSVGALCIGKGGSGGGTSGSGAAAAGGAAGTGDFSIPGQPGGIRQLTTTIASVGVNMGARGGNSARGFGAGGADIQGQGTGNAGQNYGGGGGGGASFNAGGAAAGGAGAPGLVIITEYFM